jgi:hypothetical protein
MDGGHSLMMGMFVAGVLMMAPPTVLGIWIVVYLARCQRAERAAGTGPTRGT